VVVFPNCKINLGLQVVRKRDDGFRDIETVFYPVPLQDALEIIQLSARESVHLTSSGFPIPGKVENNSSIKAYSLLKKDFPDLPPVHIHLHKVIPPGAGLGGGSSDGSFTLMALNKRFHLDIGNDKLVQYASLLGSDCSFFIQNKPCFATGRGEILNQINFDLSRYKIVIIWPGIHINTSEAFSYVRPLSDRPSIKEIIDLPITKWKDNLVNDFEEPLHSRFPVLKKIKDKLYSKGALYASLSGSGSSVYALFTYPPDLSLDFPEEYMVKTI
jgi:4-diphosphocytidyl-2-C-methyl-D-erythritol kinase